MSEMSGKIDQRTLDPRSNFTDGISKEELLATALAPIPPKEVYAPTRLEYFSVQILQGLIIGRSDQILPKVTGRAISLAKELALALDVEQNL